VPKTAGCWRSEQQARRNIVFGTGYGMSAEAMAQHAGIQTCVLCGRPSFRENTGSDWRLRMVEPEVTITELMQRIAHFRQADLEFYAKALRLAGLPE
jgi:hypothetical protein